MQACLLALPPVNQLASRLALGDIRVGARKVQIIEMPGQWRVKRQPGEKRKDYDGRNGEDERVEFLANFFQMPDHEHSEKQWMNMVVEEILVTEVLAVKKALGPGHETALVKALEKIGEVQILGRPSLLTLDNQPAFVQVGSRQPVAQMA